MTKANDLASLLDANGDVVSSALDNVPASDLVNDTTPQLGGNLDLNSNNITGTGNIDVTGSVTADGLRLGDGDYAAFGDGLDLQILHNGAGSFITDAGVGDLHIRADNNLFIQDAAGSTNRVTVNSTGVGIGTSSPTKKVSTSIGLSDTDGYVLEYSGEAKGGILLNPISGEVRMGALNSSGTYFTTLYANNSEAARIDSSGNLLVGTTTNGTTADGTVIRASAETLMTRSNGAPLLLNRRGTDGAVIEVRNDNSAVGYITANASGMGVYLGGTGSPNHLDDYEEGTWTPSDYYGAVSFTVYEAYYTKIGRKVFFELGIAIASNSNGNPVRITGLPFNSVTGNDNTGGAFVVGTNAAKTDLFIITRGQNYMNATNNSNQDVYYNTYSNKQIKLNGSYIAG